MHRQEVEALLGKPESITRDASRNIVYGYSHMRIKSSAKNYIPIVNWFTPTQINTDSQRFTVYFDKNERVKDFDQFGSSVPSGYNTAYPNNNQGYNTAYPNNNWGNKNTAYPNNNQGHNTAYPNNTTDSTFRNQDTYRDDRTTRSSSKLSLEEAKTSLLDKYLKKEITKDEYYELYKNLYEAYGERIQ